MDRYVEKLKYWLRLKADIFKDFDAYVLDKTDDKKHRIFIDCNSDILFVAHLDTVQEPKFIRVRNTKSKKPKRIYARGLDDRLGCMLAYELAAELNVDLLITDHEETYESTAEYHDCKDYNWICEFDRAGNDVVTYNQDSLDFLKALKEFWHIGQGSFSDVCFLESSACTMNLGIGYEFAHSVDSYADVKTLKDQIGRFRLFYSQYKNTSFIRDYTIDDGSMWIDNEYSRDVERCDICGMVGAIDVYGCLICQDCFEQMIFERLQERSY